MDTNLVLLWLVAAWWLLGVRNALRAARRRRPAWLIAYGIVLFATAVSYALWPTIAGIAGASVFAALVFAPALLQHHAWRLSGKQEYARASRVALVAAWLHPADEYPELVEVLDALSAARRGDTVRAEQALQQLATGGKAGIRSLASLYLHRLRGHWSQYLQLTEAAAGRSLAGDPSLFVGRLRALGETGQLDALAAEYARHERALQAPGGAQMRASARLFFAAFAGRTDLVERLVAGPLGPLDDATREYWLATSAYAAGDAVHARGRLQALAERADAMTARAAKQRLQAPPAVAGSLSDPVRRLLATMDDELTHEARHGGATELAFRPRVTLALIALNLLGFVIEELMGGSEHSAVLYRAGALFSDPALAFRLRDSWRLLSSLFLHAGLLHLTMNMFALWVLAPFVERRFGRVRMLVVYLASGLTGSLWTALAPASRPELFLGASGCIMGLLGATAAILVHGRRHEGSRVASQRLSRIALALVLQVTFDLSVPGISLVAHWSGVAVGFVVGYAFTLSLPRAV